MEHLRQQCLQRLHHDWPATLVEWDRREDAATTANGQYSPRIYYPHPILVIQLAMELDIPSIAPAAFYDLARYGPTKILTGINAVQPACDQEPQLGISSTTQDLLVRTFCGRESGQRYIADFLARELEDRPLSRACANRDVTLGAVSHADSGRLGINDCYESFYYILLNILRAIGGIASGRDADPVFTLKQTKEMLSRTDFSDGSEDGKLCGLRMCGACREEFEKCVGRAREKAWQSIPGWFDVSETWRSACGSVESTAVAW